MLAESTSWMFMSVTAFEKLPLCGVLSLFVTEPRLRGADPNAAIAAARLASGLSFTVLACLKG